MATFETFSKRKKRLENAGKKDVYQYNSFPETFRIQVIHIWRSTIGRYNLRVSGYEVNSPARGCWDTIHNTLTRENGQFFLGRPNDDPDERCQTFLMTCSADEVLDILELSFKVIDGFVRSGDYQSRARTTQSAEGAIEELNHRFREHGIGYQYVDGILVRVDSQFVHDQAVKPALALLHEAGFQGPSEEFISAFEKHKNGDSKGAIADALKAFESTMKAICDARKWSRAPNATAKPLIDIVFAKGLIPKGLESEFSALRSAMESGLPTLSNQTSRHGQGAQPIDVPDHFAAYALHLAASNIVFLVQCHKALK